MNTRMLTTVSTIAILAGSTGALAQYDNTNDRQPTKQTDRRQQDERLHFVLSEDLIGSNILGRTGDTAGSVDDIIVDAKTGKVKYVVASIGGVLGIGDKVVAIPAGNLRWDRGVKQYVLGKSGSSLENLPSFDAKKWNELQRENWEKALVDHDKSMKDHRDDMDKKDTGKDKDRDDYPKDTHRDGYQKTLVRLTDVTGTNVQARAANQDRDVTLEKNREKVGEIDGAIVEITSGHVPFVVISTGGVLGFGADDRIVPWKAMTMAGDALVLEGISAESFKDLEAVTRKDIEGFDSKDDVTAFYRPFGVEPDAFGNDTDKSKRSGG